MTWKEFKDAVEAQGMKDNTPVYKIDWCTHCEGSLQLEANNEVTASGECYNDDHNFIDFTEED